MTPDKPLNVRVAEALGAEVRWFHEADPRSIQLGGPGWWRRLQPGEFHMPAPGYRHREGDGHGHERYCAIDGCWTVCRTPYGEDSPEGWACTGPLIQRFKINLAPPAPEAHQYTIEMCGWVARHGEQEDGTWTVGAFGENPLVAACNVILALAKAGRLPT